MLALSFGTDAEREYALHGIRTIHTRVNGRLPEAVGVFPAGAAYSAEDPALVLWVHLTLIESIPLAYERFVGPVSDQERDSYCAESAWVATALGARPADVPVTWGHASEQLARMYASGTLRVGSQARALSGFQSIPATLQPRSRSCSRTKPRPQPMSRARPLRARHSTARARFPCRKRPTRARKPRRFDS